MKSNFGPIIGETVSDCLKRFWDGCPSTMLEGAGKRAQLSLEFGREVARLRALRPDIEVDTLPMRVRALAEGEPITHLQVLRWCVHLAQEGSPMPWERVLK